MSVASIEKKLDDIDVVVVQDDVSAAEEKEGKTSCLLEKCSVCDTPLHQSRFPQLFPCLHSACSTCLSKQHVEENNRKSIECPSCKKLFPITEVTENIIFKQSLPLSGRSDVFKCGGCEEQTVSGWCKDCGEFLCSDCVSAHNRVKLTRDHTIVPQELSAGSHPTLYCETHREEPLKFFCATCNQLTCRNCQLVDHRNHSYQMVTEAIPSVREKLQALQGQVTKQKERVQQSQLDLDQRLQNIKDLKSGLKKKLSLVVSKMHRALLTKAVQLYQSTVAAYAREETQLAHRKAVLGIMEDRQDYMMSFIEKTLSVEGHAGVLLKNRIESQIKDLLFQSVLPAHNMLEITIKVNQSIMTSVNNFGGISLKLVPFARNHSSQSEPLLESVPILDNVPSDCIINTMTSSTSPSPDSSTQEALLGRSLVAPHSHTPSFNTPHNFPSSSRTSQGSSSDAPHTSKDCIVNTVTSTTSPDQTCAQAARHGQSPTTHDGQSHYTQPGQAAPSSLGFSHSDTLRAQPSLQHCPPAYSSITHSQPLNVQCSLPQTTPALSSVMCHSLNTQPIQPTPALLNVTHSQPLNVQCSLPQSTPSSCNVPHSNRPIAPNSQLCQLSSKSGSSNAHLSQTTSLHSLNPSLNTLLSNAVLGHPQAMPVSSNAPLSQFQSQLQPSNHLVLPQAPLFQAQSHVNLPTLQQQRTALPVSVPTTTIHHQKQGQTAFIIVPSSPVVSNASQVVSPPFGVVNVTGKTVQTQPVLQVQQASFTGHSQAILTPLTQSGHSMFQGPSSAQVQQGQASSIVAKHAQSHPTGSPVNQSSAWSSHTQLSQHSHVTSRLHTMLSAPTDPAKAQTQTQSNSFQPSPSALVQQVPAINQPGSMLSPSAASQRVCLPTYSQGPPAAATDLLKAQPGNSKSPHSTPPLSSLSSSSSSLIQQAQVSSVDAKHAPSHPTTSPLDQSNSLSPQLKPPQSEQPSVTKKDLFATTDSDEKKHSGHSRTSQSNILDPPPSALDQQSQVSSVDAKHPQFASPDHSGPPPPYPKPKPHPQPSSTKHPILHKVLLSPCAATQDSQKSPKTPSNKSMSLQDPRTMKLMAKRLQMLQKKAASSKKFQSKTWKFHDCKPDAEPEKTNQPTHSGSSASVSSADGQPPPTLSFTPASLGPHTAKTLNLTPNKPRCSFKRRPSKEVGKFHADQPSPDPKQVNLSSPSGSASEVISAGLLGPQSDDQTLTPHQCQEQKESQAHLTKDAHNVHSNWLNGLPQSFREILGVDEAENLEQDSLQTNCEDADRVQIGGKDSMTSDKAVVEDTDTSEMETMHPEKMLRCQVNLFRLEIQLPAAGCPLPRFRVDKEGCLKLISLLDVKEEELGIDSENSSSPLVSLDSPENNLDCKVCNTDRASVQCVTCERAFHRACHVPPITTKVCISKWKCSLCQDLSDSRDPFRKDRHRKLWLNSLDQRRCEHLLLALMCKKYSSVLYNSCKGPGSSVDFEFIHERLLRQRSPSYRTPSELVSDIWVLLDSLLSTDEEIDDVLKIQKSFQKKVNQVFGNALHPSLLTRPTVKRERDLAKTGSHSKKKTYVRDSDSDSSEESTEPVVKKPHQD